MRRVGVEIRIGEILERLDRVLFNVEQRSLFPNFEVIHEPTIGSDHVPVVVNSEWRDGKGKKRFRFENIWTTSRM